jgi:hypothetical protein
LENAVPITKRSWQIAPRRARTRDPQYCVDKQTIVLAVPPLIPFFTRNKSLDAPPLRVRQFSPNQDRPPQLRS